METLEGLERKLKISVPAEEVEEQVGDRLQKLARTAKIDGFRQGKVPLSLIKRKYSDSVRKQVAQDMVEPTLYQALKEKDLVPAGMRNVEPEEVEPGKDFTYTAVIEVFPEFEINELNQTEVECVLSEVSEKDIDATLEALREKKKEWVEVSRPIRNGDKAVIDFEGFIDGTPFEGGDAQGYGVEVGSNQMLKEFEEGLLDKETNDSFELPIQFPENYGAKNVAGQQAIFKITISKIMEAKLPELDNAFAEAFDIKDGGVEALRNEIKKDMERNLDRQLSGINRENLFSALLACNSFDLPKSLIEKEIDHLRHELFHQLQGPSHSDNEKIPNYPSEWFMERAKRRVQLGLLLSEYTKKHQLSADDARVEAMIDKLASAYESPSEVRSLFQNSKERMSEIKALVLEEMAADKIKEHAKIVKKTKSYAEVTNPKKDTSAEGEQDDR